MSTAAVTTADLFWFPEDGIERDLIRGELREFPKTFRTRVSSQVLVRVAQILKRWSESQDAEEWELAMGNVGVRLQKEPDTTVGIDVVLYRRKDVLRMPSDQLWYEGPPAVAIEILSPPDTHAALVERINLYLGCGVPVVWVFDPEFQTLTVHLQDQIPRQFGVTTIIDGSPELPGLSVSVSKFFD